MLGSFLLSNNNFKPFKNPLVIALDVDDANRALQIADQLSPYAGGFKIGPRLSMRYGSEFCQKIAERGPLFIDNKYFDIPSTMVAAVKASFEAGASLVTVHALAGADALVELSKLENELCKLRDFRILCVSVLTSWDQNTLSENFKSISIAEHVKILQKLILSSGLKSIVCSAKEAFELRQTIFPNQMDSKDFFILTPGIRMAEENIQDQKRTQGPREAMKLGASAIVVGRPIIDSKNVTESAKKYLQELGLA